MGSAPTKPSRREGLYFDDYDAASPDVSDDEDERPKQVYGFKFENITCYSFDVSWIPPADQKTEQYQVRVFPPEGIRTKSLINSLESPSYSFERLTSGTRYTVGVVAIDENGKRSTCASASESTFPQPPTDMEFPVKQTTASTFRVEWRASKGNRDCYQLEITPTEGVTGKTFVEGLQETYYVFTGLVPGTKYRVKVASVANGRRSEALENSVITNPGHVYDLTFPSVTHNEMHVVWKPPPGKVECYTLRLKGDKETDPIEISKITQTSYKFNGLVTGRNYQCEICTHALGKISMWKTFDQCTLPSEVTNLSVAKVTVNEAVITWSSAPGDFEDYDLFLNPKEGVEGDPCPRGIVGNVHTFKGLRPGTKYTVGVVANAKDKISQRVVTAFLTEPAPCGEITFPPDELKSTQIGVHWLPARGECDSYTVLVIKDGGVGGSWKEEDIVKPNHVFTGLTPGAEYSFNITTMREGRHSVSNSACCSTLPCPAGILEFPAGGTTTTSIKFCWNPSAGGVDSYKIQACGGGSKIQEFAKFDKSDFTLTNLLPATEYEISVSVISFGVESEPSIAKRMTGPDSVQNLETKTMSKNTIKVTWKPPQGGADAYDLELLPSEGVYSETNPKGVEKEEYTFEHLIPGTLYNMTVTPMARGVWGPPEKVYGYTTPGDILNVHFPADCITTDSMKVVWGVEGNSKDVLATLMSGEETQDIMSDSVIQSAAEYVFKDLKENTPYTVKLEALGSRDLAMAGGDDSKGSAAIFSQKTIGKPVEEEPVRDASEASPVQDNPPKVSEDSSQVLEPEIENDGKENATAIEPTPIAEKEVPQGNDGPSSAQKDSPTTLDNDVPPHVVQSQPQDFMSVTEQDVKLESETPENPVEKDSDEVSQVKTSKSSSSSPSESDKGEP